MRTGGHNKDRDWAALVEAEFAHDFTGVDFVHGHKYRTLALPWVEQLRVKRGAAAALSSEGEWHRSASA